MGLQSLFRSGTQDNRAETVRLDPREVEILRHVMDKIQVGDLHSMVSTFKPPVADGEQSKGPSFKQIAMFTSLKLKCRNADKFAAALNDYVADADPKILEMVNTLKPLVGNLVGLSAEPAAIAHALLQCIREGEDLKGMPPADAACALVSRAEGLLKLA